MRKNNQFPLVAETHPENYKGYEFITLIQFNDENFLVVVDNLYNDQIIAYVLDYCGPANVDEEKLISIVNGWHETSRSKYPVSIQFSRLGIAEEMSKIRRLFPVDFVSRVIGPLPEFNMGGPSKIKKRKKKSIPKGIEFIDKRILRKKPT